MADLHKIPSPEAVHALVEAAADQAREQLERDIELIKREALTIAPAQLAISPPGTVTSCGRRARCSSRTSRSNTWPRSSRTC